MIYFIQSEEKIKALMERLELAEQKLAQFSIRNDAANDAIDEKNKQDALSQVYQFVELLLL